MSELAQKHVEKNQELFGDAPCVFLNADLELDILEKTLPTIAETIGDRYAVISDPLFSKKVKSIVEENLPGKEYVGVASVPFADWREEKLLFDYVVGDILKTEEDTVIAFAASVWNFKARDVNTAYREWLKKQEG